MSARTDFVRSTTCWPKRRSAVSWNCRLTKSPAATRSALWTGRRRAPGERARRLSGRAARGARAACRARALLPRVLGLAEHEDKIVGFADGHIPLAILVALRERGRQRPDPVDPVFRVARIRQYLGGADQLEAGLGRELDRIVLAHVAILRLRILWPVGATAVLLDAEDAAGLECAIAGRQCLRRITAIHPVVQVTKRQHQIGRSRRSDVEVVRSERRLNDRAVVLGLRSEARAPAHHRGVLVGIPGRR